MIERTLLIIKPDAVKRNLIGEIIKRCETKGLQVDDLRYWASVSHHVWEEHYTQHKKELFFADLIKKMQDKPVVVVLFIGESSVARLRELIGATKVSEAEKGTIRGDLGEEGRPVHENLVHASDSPEAAVREIEIWQ